MAKVTSSNPFLSLSLSLSHIYKDIYTGLYDAILHLVLCCIGYEHIYIYILFVFRPLKTQSDSYTQHKKQPLNVVRVFRFILKTKHKTLHVKRAWAKLENSAEKQSARALID